MCNPDDIEPCISGTPSQAAIQGDTRSHGQRNHDALLVAARALLASGDLGQHNGLPTSIIVTTTLQELEAGAGKALTGGGTLLPMSDVIRLGSHAHHYLAIFDKGKALALYHTKRLASPAQRIMLHARDRGCTFPGCTVPGYQCQVHHNDPYATTPRHRHQHPGTHLPPQPPTSRPRLQHPHQHPRPNRMDPTTTPRPRTTTHQHLPPPRKTAAQRRRRCAVKRCVSARSAHIAAPRRHRQPARSARRCGSAMRRPPPRTSAAPHRRAASGPARPPARTTRRHSARAS